MFFSDYSIANPIMLRNTTHDARSKMSKCSVCTQGIKKINFLIAMWIEDVRPETATNLIDVFMGDSMLQKIWVSVSF